jgi:hypothetical protein
MFYVSYLEGKIREIKLEHNKVLVESYILFRPAIQNRILPRKTFSKFTLKTALLELNILIVGFTLERDFLFNIQANMLNKMTVNSIDIQDPSCAPLLAIVAVHCTAPLLPLSVVCKAGFHSEFHLKKFGIHRSCAPCM